MGAGGRAHIRPELGGVTDKPAFVGRCARAFDLPEYFGRNGDALAAEVFADADDRHGTGAELRIVLALGGSS
ncbi:barstar family protein [Streptomyces akebiae]|uniref:Barstar family protein n=1 Tax=Streptomyces akebiae TaxID=2865673 RepID=A0ABX8Y5B9_9ACTN|nr:barstar family protein [Streptomyces akebiae]